MQCAAYKNTLYTMCLHNMAYIIYNNKLFWGGERNIIYLSYKK